MTNNQYIPMRDIGAAIDMTSHQIGRRLKQLGLRTQNGKPTRLAFQQGLCAQRWAHDRRGYCWAWDANRVLDLLGGHGPKEDRKPDPAAPRPPTTTTLTSDQSDPGPSP